MNQKSHCFKHKILCIYFTWLVVAVIMLTGSVKTKAIAHANRSPHHGRWTWSFRAVQRIRDTVTVTIRRR